VKDEDRGLAAMTDEEVKHAKAQDERARAVHQETSAMHTAFVALQPLDRNAQKRAVRWLAEALEDVEVPF
jgi:hypothetical protein